MRAGLTSTRCRAARRPRIHGVSNLRSIPDGFRVLSTIIRLSFTRINGGKQKKTNPRDRRRVAANDELPTIPGPEHSALHQI